MNSLLRFPIIVPTALLALGFPAQAQQSGTSPVKIIIMAGQSNMLGQGEISPATTQGTLEYIATPANDPNGDYAFLGSPGSWVVRDDVWIRDQNGQLGGLTAGYGSTSTTIGPELGFGHHAGDLNERQIIIVKAAWGGKSLAVDFRPPSSGGTTGFFYNEILRLVNEMTDNLDTNPSTYFPDYDFSGGYEIAGFCWHQGWNDRDDPVRSAEYEANMANFIRDIRSSENGIGVPDLPFVIATTGMDGSSNYTTVELAQLEMTNTTKYPDFAGNVAVIDTRTNYEDLDFWQPAANSPSPGGTQGFHWNRNAKTYVNLGLAMSDAMSTLSPARCPFRLRASGGPGGVALTWQNGSELPLSVRVLCDSVEIAASAPVSPASFLDPAAEPGVHDYELQFTMPGDPCDPLTVTFDAGITDLEAYRSPGGIALTWTNNLGYIHVEVRRNGTLIGTIAGTATTYTDASPPSSGLITYSVVPTNGSASPTETEVNLDGPPSGNAVIYEPFDYTVGGLNGQGGAQAGLDGKWFADSTAQVTAGTLGYETLPVGGAKLSNFSANQNRYGGSRAIIPTALAASGLLNDGATLWFSFIAGLQDGANRTNTRLAVALGAGSFGTGAGDFFISGGTGVGVYMTNGVPHAASFPADSGGASPDSNNSPQYQVGQFDLIVGKITWGANGGSVDTIELYKPGSDLALPGSPISTHAVVVDQSTYDTLTFRRNDQPLLDEIRFGASYDDVIGADLMVEDTTPPDPDPMTWATVPSAAGDSSITMTATTASDASGVQYEFTRYASNGVTVLFTSPWQSSSIFTDTGLAPSTEYKYTVRARDLSANNNTTNPSTPVVSATTDAVDNGAPPTPDFDVAPVATSPTEIMMTAETVIDPEGSAVEYYFTETSGNPGGSDSDWQDSTTYIDSGLNPSTTYSYTVRARDKSAQQNASLASAAFNATTQDLPAGPGGAVIYDSFDYAAGSVSGGSGGTGFTGNWATRNAAPQVVTPGLDWGTLSVAGNSVTDVTGGSAYRDLGASSVLDSAGLMANGGTLWFSVMVNVAGTNRTNVDFNFSLGSDGFHTYVAGGGGTFGERMNLETGEGIGFALTNRSSTLMDVESAYWKDDADADIRADRIIQNTDATDLINRWGGDQLLIVGRIDWGAGDLANEAITLYAPDTSLALGTGKTWNTIAPLDQSAFDTVAFELKGGAIIDEIRFGATSDDVLGLGGSTSDYDTWAGGSFLGKLGDSSPELDFDGGGLDTGIEWVVGGDPTDRSDDSSKAPVFDNNTDPDKFLFIFRRSDLANADENTTITAQYGSSLSGWDPAAHQGAGPTQITITEDDDFYDDGIDKVTVAIPRNLALGETLFVRLKVTVAGP